MKDQLIKELDDLYHNKTLKKITKEIMGKHPHKDENWVRTSTYRFLVQFIKHYCKTSSLNLEKAISIVVKRKLNCVTENYMMHILLNLRTDMISFYRRRELKVLHKVQRNRL